MPIRFGGDAPHGVDNDALRSASSLSTPRASILAGRTGAGKPRRVPRADKKVAINQPFARTIHPGSARVLGVLRRNHAFCVAVVAAVTVGLHSAIGSRCFVFFLFNTYIYPLRPM